MLCYFLHLLKNTIDTLADDSWLILPFFHKLSNIKNTKFHKVYTISGYIPILLFGHSFWEIFHLWYLHNGTVWDIWQHYFLCGFHPGMTAFKKGLCLWDYVTSLIHLKISLDMYFLKTHMKFHLQAEDTNLCLETCSPNLRNKLYSGGEMRNLSPLRAHLSPLDIWK